MRFYDGLSTRCPKPTGYGPARLAPPQPPIDPATGASSRTPPEPVVIEELRATSPTLPRARRRPGRRRCALTGGRDGLAPLTVDDFVGEPVATGRRSGRGRARSGAGCARSKQIAEIGLLAVPDVQVRPIDAEPDRAAAARACPIRASTSPPAAPAAGRARPARAAAGVRGPTTSTVSRRRWSCSASGCATASPCSTPPYDASTSALAGIRGVLRVAGPLRHRRSRRWTSRG